MAENFARKGIKIQDVSAGFVELENVSQLQSSLKEAGELQDPMILFHDMWEVAQDPKSNFKKYELIRSSRKHLDSFKALVRSISCYQQPTQVAASSEKITIRTSSDFDLELKASLRDDGVFFIILKMNVQVKDAPTHLYYLNGDDYSIMKIPPVRNGMSQVMTQSDNPILKAFNDPNTEFFIK